ncbi:ABC transporter ATP-binding protein [Streptomyces sp. ID05-39B]|uniref:ABC transporter ATP-binding protein n=1 Tax=Streptomyces sp. ID05-39B TaxID=3028664 RepID=UPI0029BEFD1D|nr:ABC transporter ATP-binding protein [Streptomyces sp. ID05-39B]MDX3530519.1 ABC transporter ATP-binding protein [Streptomyces sp. ID05-39B]
MSCNSRAIRARSRRYGAGPPALDDVTLSVRAGEALAVVGPSGSGKSTLLNLIAGLDRPSAGSVTVGGVRVDQLNETGSARYRRDRIGMVFQFFNLLDDLTVHDNVLLPAQLAGMPRAEARGRTAELLRHLGIERHAAAYPGRLSGGERQRVAVARALMNRPALLLADEPTGALDTASGEQVRELLTGLNADGQTIVLVTHDLALARSCATRTVELVDGRVVRDSGTVPGHRQALTS